MTMAGARGRALAFGAWALLVLCFVLGRSRIASAQETPTASRSTGLVAVDIAPVTLNQPSQYLPSLTELYVRIANNGKVPISGDVVATQREYGADAHDTRAPFSVAPNASVVLHLPVSAKQALSVAVRSARGETLAETQMTPIAERAVRVFDLSEVSRIKAAVDGINVTTDYADDPGASTGYGPPTRGGTTMSMGPASTASPWLRVSAMHVDGATGTPIVPLYVGGYAGTHLVVASTDTLTKLTATEIEALSGFVLGGGTLALRVTRPEDLRNATVAAFVGGDATTAAPGDELRASVPAVSDAVPQVTAPGDGVVLTTYGGGNLRPSLFGANAAYGLGEVVLLAFDPYDATTMGDAWVRGRVVELARRAFERTRFAVATPLREPAMLYYYSRRDPTDEVRKLLDPNQAARWGIAVATLIICGYSVIAGPLIFSIARKKNRPLSALRILPIASFAAFSIIVLLGFMAKGVGVSAHRLAMVDAGAGMSKGTVRRFRGFFSPNAQTMEVRGSDRTASFKIPGMNGTTIGDFEVDRDGQRLVGYESMPSQTVLVREDGIASIGDGVSIRPGATPNDCTITNHVGKKLRALVVKLPDDSFRYAATLEDGASVECSTLDAGNKSFKAWSATVGARPAGRVQVHPLESGMSALKSALGDAGEKDLGVAWDAMSSVNGEAVDWFPAGLPVVLAAVDGGEGLPKDSGVKVARDMLLVRIVGWGGKP